MYPSSKIKLSLYVYVHHALHWQHNSTCASNLTGTVWNFLYDEGGKYSAQKCPPSILHSCGHCVALLSNEAGFPDLKMSVSVDVEESDFEHAPKDLQEIALHLGWQSARTSQALAAKTMNGPLKYRNEVLEYVEDILDVLSDLSPVSLSIST